MARHYIHKIERVGYFVGKTRFRINLNSYFIVFAIKNDVPNLFDNDAPFCAWNTFETTLRIPMGQDNFEKKDVEFCTNFARIFRKGF